MLQDFDVETAAATTDDDEDEEEEDEDNEDDEDGDEIEVVLLHSTSSVTTWFLWREKIENIYIHKILNKENITVKSFLSCFVWLMKIYIDSCKIKYTKPSSARNYTFTSA